LSVTVRHIPALTRRRLLVAGAASAGLTALGGIARPAVSRAADRPRITHGLQSGDVTADSGVVWARTDRPARMLVEAAASGSFRDAIASTYVAASRSHRPVDDPGRRGVHDEPVDSFAHSRPPDVAARGARAGPARAGQHHTAGRRLHLGQRARLVRGRDLAGEGYHRGGFRHRVRTRPGRRAPRHPHGQRGQVLPAVQEAQPRGLGARAPEKSTSATGRR
jgi:alkaline phosphatase D